MKKLLVILLPISIFLVSCGGGEGELQPIDPPTASLEKTLVGKTWKLLDTYAGWFHLNNDNTYSTKDSLCDTLEVYGTWELDNYDLIFTYFDGTIENIQRNTIISASYSIIKILADTSSTSDTNLVFVTTEDVIRGCMDSTFSNFNPDALCPDICINYGCMDMNALNYNSAATVDDGSCCYVLSGCTDNYALNYDSNACQDDGSCCYIEGCMDSSAFNYDPNACQDDGSCDYSVDIGDYLFGGIVFWGGTLNGQSVALIASSTDYNAEWGCTGTIISGADGTFIGTGAQNTIDIEAECTTSGIAAEICANLTTGGYSDWFLPSINELEQMYLNIGGGNARGLGNIGNFTNDHYWSSSEAQGWSNAGNDLEPNYAHSRNLLYGQTAFATKYSIMKLRPIRLSTYR